MKSKIKLFVLPLLMGMVLFSCDSSSDEKEPGGEPSIAYKALVKYEVELEDIKHKVTNTTTGEVLTDVDFAMEDVAALVCVTHDATTGKFVRMLNFSKSMLEGITTDGVTTLSESLPFGKYYVTFVVMTENHLDSRLLEALTKNYSKAACPIPNEHVYYNTYRLVCMPEGGLLPEKVTEDINFEKKVSLKLITGEYVLTVNETEKIPADANFSMMVEVKNIPSTIFIQTGRTLSDEEAASLKLYKFSSKREITNIAELNKSSIVAKVYCIPNDGLYEEERGRISFVYKENAQSGKEEQKIDKVLPVRDMYTLGYYDMIGLYTGKGEVAPIEPEIE